MKVKRAGLECRLKEECRLRHLSRMTYKKFAKKVVENSIRYNAKWTPKTHTKEMSKKIMEEELAAIQLRFHPPEDLRDQRTKKKRMRLQNKCATPDKKKKRTTASKRFHQKTTPITPPANQNRNRSLITPVSMPRRRSIISQIMLRPDQTRKVDETRRQLRVYRATHSRDEMQTTQYARGVPGVGQISYWDVYQLSTYGSYINDIILNYMLFTLCPQARVPSGYLDLRRTVDLLFGNNDGNNVCQQNSRHNIGLYVSDR